MAKYKRAKRNKYGSIMLPNKKTITLAEQKEYKNLVARANRKRARMIRELPNERRAVGYLFGADTNFIYSKKSYSLSRFRNRSEFDEAVRQLKKYTNKNYLRDRTATYKRNYIGAIRDTYGDSAKDVINKLHNMPLDEFQRLVQSGDLEEIGYVYNDPEEGKLDILREQIGISTDKVLNAKVDKKKRAIVNQINNKVKVKVKGK